MADNFEKITDTQLVRYLKDKTCSYWKECKFKKIFPGVLPVSMEKRDFQVLKNKPYVVCAKMDGERFFLLMTTRPSKFNSLKCIRKKITVLINRQFEFFEVKQKFTDNNVFTKDTLLDGEYLDNQFIVHDSICIAGGIIKEQNWEYRWKTCDIFLDKAYCFDETCSFRICLKHFFPINCIKSLMEHVDKNNIKQDGYIFYPVNEPIKFKTQWELFKLKPPDLHTIDFKINFTNDDKCQLLTWDKGRDIIYATLDKNEVNILGPMKSGQIIEFKVKNQKFIPYKIRNDKKTSNNFLTTEKTMLNERENIKIEDIIELFN